MGVPASRRTLVRSTRPGPPPVPPFPPAPALLEPREEADALAVAVPELVPEEGRDTATLRVSWSLPPVSPPPLSPSEPAAPSSPPSISTTWASSLAPSGGVQLPAPVNTTRWVSIWVWSPLGGV